MRSASLGDALRWRLSVFRQVIAPAVVAFFLPLGAGASAAIFPDIPDDHPSVEAIDSLKAQGVISGMHDGLLRPDRRVNRAEFLTMLMRATKEDASCASADVFPDVPSDAWFATAVCQAQQKGIADDTQELFRPADPITLGETAALLTRAFDLAPVGAADPWYAPFVRAVGERQAIPQSLQAAGQNVSRAEMAEMIWRLNEGRTDRPAADAKAILAAQCVWMEEDVPPGIDMQEVRGIWLSWVNELRTRHGLSTYRSDRTLNLSAQQWSKNAKAAGAITHKRPGQAAYYDFGMLTDWFASRDLSFQLHNGSLHTENIGWGMYRCGEGDCTRAMTDAIRTTVPLKLPPI